MGGCTPDIAGEVGAKAQPIEIRETATFSGWLRAIRDARTKAIIAARIRRLALGNSGDVRPVGEGVSELHIHHGPGYRVYYAQPERF